MKAAYRPGHPHRKTHPLPHPPPENPYLHRPFPLQSPIPAAMADSDDDEFLANFLESEILSEQSSPQGEASTSTSDRPPKRQRMSPEEEEKKSVLKQIDSGIFSRVPHELYHQILKFLSPEDLIACALVCHFMNCAASDECLWRRLYCMRWGASPAGKLRESAWKKLYIQRDQEDMVEFVRNTPSEFKEYYIQMQAAKRSQAPLPSQVNDDTVILDRTVADQVSIWKSSRGLPDDAVIGHACSGNTCLYTQIGDVFLCEKTGRVHVCGENCREVLMDQYSGLLVCTISGQCFDRWLTPEEESDTEQQQGVAVDEAEPFMGYGRFARAYELGYNCADEKELEATLRFC